MAPTMLEQALQAINDGGYTVLVEFINGLEYDTLRLLGGDTNCPHNKFYDPKDHHGYTDLEILSDMPLADVLPKAYEYVKTIEGTPTPGEDTICFWKNNDYKLELMDEWMLRRHRERTI